MTQALKNSSPNPLHDLPRHPVFDEDFKGLIYPDAADLELTEHHVVRTTGLGPLDAKEKDLLQIIKITDALEGQFDYLDQYSPRTYAESLDPIPQHITVQSVIYCDNSPRIAALVAGMQEKYSYGKTPYDRFWIGPAPETLQPDDKLLIMNRRVGGWDGSVEKPVIELLCAGGHIPTIIEDGKLKTLSQEQVILDEVNEEIGLTLTPDRLYFFGGFHNGLTNELVLLYGIHIREDEIEFLQQNAYGNIDKNINGIYMGEFRNVLGQYLTDATNFAGGEKAKPTNFPSQKSLMERIYNRLYHRQN